MTPCMRVLPAGARSCRTDVNNDTHVPVIAAYLYRQGRRARKGTGERMFENVR